VLDVLDRHDRLIERAKKLLSWIEHSKMEW
jgi:hypothetical protein